jgi:hypothetical protein
MDKRRKNFDRKARHEWEQRAGWKRLELMAEFKKASDRHA